MAVDVAGEAADPRLRTRRHGADAETYSSLAWFVGGKSAENVVQKRVISADVDLKTMPGATAD